jgi:hypothetical protein
MNNSSYLNVCNCAEFLSQNEWLWAVRYLRIAIATLSIALCSILFRIQGKYLAMHPNARLLLISHNIWAILQSLTQLITHLFDVVRFSATYTDPCQYLVTMLVSVIVRAPAAIALYGQIWALTTMAVERLVATFRYRTYESSTGTLLGKILIMAQVPYLF